MKNPTKKGNEFDECCTLVDYLNYLDLTFSHVHNEMWTSSWGQINKAKALGVKSGVPDYMIIINGKLIFIEMKASRQNKSQTSKTQKQWLKELNECEGVDAYIAKGFDQAKEIIDKYVKQ